MAVYDEENGTLQLVEARNMALRGCVRTEASRDEDQESEAEGEVLVSPLVLFVSDYDAERKKTVLTLI